MYKQIGRLLSSFKFLDFKLCEYDNTAKLTFLWYNNFGVKKDPLHRNGMAAIPKKNRDKKQL